MKRDLLNPLKRDVYIWRKMQRGKNDWSNMDDSQPIKKRRVYK